MDSKDNINVIVASEELGDELIPIWECDHENPLTARAYDELDREMAKRGWVDENSIVLIKDLKIGCSIWRDETSGKYHFGLRAYRGNTAPRDLRF